MVLSSDPDLFYIQTIPIKGRLVLAPMDGISDPTFRWITRELGSAYSVSEFVNTLDFANMRHYQINRLQFRESERPFAFQLLDNDPIRMAEGAVRLKEEFKPDFFDINMGCPTRNVTSRGAGAGMMRSPQVAARAVQSVREATGLPVTVKLRLGWDEDNLNYREVAESVVEAGADLIALHGRTSKMAYGGRARWEPISELKRVLPVPIIGNGDVTSVAAARRMLKETGCDAVMVGRTAKDNPWIFSWRERFEVGLEEVLDLAHKQYAEMARTYPPGTAIMAFRKFIKSYLSPYQLGSEVLRPLLTSQDETTFLSQLNGIFTRLAYKP